MTVKSNKLLSRNEISDQYKWNLTDIYATDQDWEAELAEVKASLPQLQQYRGKLGQSGNLVECMAMQEALGKKLSKLAVYAMMKKDQDNTNDVYQGYSDQISSLGAQIGQSLAYIEPELLALPDGTIANWIDDVEELKVYQHYLENIIRTKPHTLPTEQEELLASASEMAQSASNIFRMFNNADLTFPEIKDEAGNLVELTHGRYIQFMESKDREVRKGAFQALYKTYGDWRNTLATTYTSAVKRSLFYARARKYESSLESALDADNVKPDVYHNLISTIHDSFPEFYRYMKLRKKLLGVDDLHMYDVYVPLVKDLDIEIPYQEAIEKVKEGLAPLGDQYVNDLTQGMTGGWIDWFENKGKTSGAYSTSVYGVHPYVLMNYQDNMDNMFTLAHEMGHAMHSFYSDRTQNYINSNYTIFVAEVASTLNESLLMNHLLETTTDEKTKLYLLNHYLEQFRGTIFRQTMFAEFEMLVHDRINQGEPMTAESLSQTYHQLNKDYFGPDVVIDEEIAMEWARIPHFYRPFYVYKYATGFSAAVALSEQILSEKQPAVDRYLTFLSSGGSDYPLNLLKRAGVDMNTPEPIVAAMKVFSSLIDQMEALI